jgi:pantothenate synthetase
MEALRGPGVTPEYLALVGDDLRPAPRADARTVALVAARIGTTRLIDNVVLGEGLGNDISVRAS